MKTVLSLTLVIAVSVSAIIGCLVIFNIFTVDQGMDYLYKALSAIFLLGAASALIRFVTDSKGSPGE